MHQRFSILVFMKFQIAVDWSVDTAGNGGQYRVRVGGKWVHGTFRIFATSFGGETWLLKGSFTDQGSGYCSGKVSIEIPKDDYRVDPAEVIWEIDGSAPQSCGTSIGTKIRQRYLP